MLINSVRSCDSTPNFRGYLWVKNDQTKISKDFFTPKLLDEAILSGAKSCIPLALSNKLKGADLINPANLKPLMELIEEATGDEFITNLPKVNKNTYFIDDLNEAVINNNAGEIIHLSEMIQDYKLLSIAEEITLNKENNKYYVTNIYKSGETPKYQGDYVLILSDAHSEKMSLEKNLANVVVGSIVEFDVSGGFPKEVVFKNGDGNGPSSGNPETPENPDVPNIIKFALFLLCSFLV